jgi:hypothetical protein
MRDLLPTLYVEGAFVLAILIGIVVVVERMG